MSRAFGVELEFNTHYQGGTDFVRSLLNKHGLIVNNNTEYDEETFKLGYDGSEVELKTPILRGYKGFRILKKTMDLLVSSGCRANSRDGMHVHFDVPEFRDNHQNCVRLVKSWQANKPIINQFVSSRRAMAEFGPAPDWNNTFLRELESGLTDYDPYYRETRPKNFGRRELNLDALARHGTIEVRLHEGTLDYKEAEAWIKFCLKFFDTVAQRKTVLPALDTDTLFKRVRVTKVAAETLKKKARVVR